MPAGKDCFNIAKDSLSTFADIFERKTISILLPFLKTDGYLPIPAGYDVIYPRKEDLKIFSIPRKIFIQRLREHQFDITLDLDLEDGFFNGYTCLKCEVPLRIGPKRENAFPFYNIQLTVLQERSNNREIYERMAKMLKNLFLDNEKIKPNPL